MIRRVADAILINNRTQGIHQYARSYAQHGGKHGDDGSARREARDRDEGKTHTGEIRKCTRRGTRTRKYIHGDRDADTVSVVPVSKARDNTGGADAMSIPGRERSTQLHPRAGSFNAREAEGALRHGVGPGRARRMRRNWRARKVSACALGEDKWDRSVGGANASTEGLRQERICVNQ
ncbi:hypothetical protein C8R44DRAFT_730306 [Mycena epipterygia]|nr:hypothetical protein C8R44DRAFT_730306 [Mycena epipterygia]